MSNMNGVTPAHEGFGDLAEGTPAGTTRVMAHDAPPDGQRVDPSDSRHASRSTVAGRPRGILRLGHVDTLSGCALPREDRRRAHSRLQTVAAAAASASQQWRLPLAIRRGRPRDSRCCW